MEDEPLALSLKVMYRLYDSLTIQLDRVTKVYQEENTRLRERVAFLADGRGIICDEGDCQHHATAYCLIDALYLCTHHSQANHAHD